MVQKLFRKLLPANILSGLALALCNQIDAMLISRFLGVGAVTAYGLFVPISLIMSAFAAVFLSGVAAVCSSHFGRGDRDAIHANFSSTVLLSIVISVVSAFVVFFGAGSLAKLLGATPNTEIFEMLTAYAKMYAIGIPAYIVLQALSAYLHLAGKRSYVIAAILTVAVLDTVLDIVSGLADWGMRGMALASTVSQIAGLAVALSYFVRKSSLFRFSFRKLSGSELGKVLVGGSSRAITQVCFTLATFFANMMLLKYTGEAAVAAFSIVNTLGSLIFTLDGGCAMTAQILTGIYYGEGNRERLTETVRIGIRWILMISGAITLLCVVFAEPIVKIYTDDPDVIRIGRNNLRIYSVSICFSAINTLLQNCYMSTKRSKFSQSMTLLGDSSPIIVELLLAPLLHALGVWLAIPIGQAVCTAVFLVIAAKEGGKINASALARLKPDFGFAAEDVLDLTVKTAADAVAASDAAGKFCREHNRGNARASSFTKYLALCVEELTIFNLQKHEDEPGEHTISLRVATKDEKWVIQMQDDYRSFDFAEYIKLHHADDAISHLGIRIIFAAVEEVTYLNTLGYNNLTLSCKQ